MAMANAHLSALPDRQRGELESWLVDFDLAWEKGRLAARVSQLPPPGDPRRLPALIEMVKIDLERQWQAGRQVGLETYLEAYPELGTPETLPADLIQAEYEVRNQYGVPVSLAEYERRFPRQAGELGRLVDRARQVIGETATAEASRTQPGGGAPSPAPGPATPPDPLPERFGRYQILKRLGRGGMGSVYLAHDTQLERQVALKVPKFAPDDGPEVLERFQREAKSAATIQHPNLCPVYDVGQIDGVHYLTMAYVKGRPLSDYTQNPKPLDQLQVAAVVRKLALALEEAHQKGVVHRDLKPANVMINERREPVILDFGLARREGRGDTTLTQTGAVMGTPAYMAPEQVRGEQESIGPACDVYSLGVILYELLARELPFRGSVGEVLGRIQFSEPPPLSEFRSDVDPALEAICRKAMSKETADRYPSMAALAEALEGYLRKARQGGPGKDSGATKSAPVTPPRAMPLALAGPSAPEQPEPGTETLAAQFFADLAKEPPPVVASRLRTRPTRQQAHRRIAAPPWMVVVGATAAAVLLLGVVLTIATRKGTVTIRFDHPDAAGACSVFIDGDEIGIGRQGETIALTPGEYLVVVQRGDVDVETHELTIRRGKNAALVIRYRPEAVAAGPMPRRETAPVAATPIPSDEPPAVRPEIAGEEEADTPRNGAQPPLAIAPFDADAAKRHQEAWAHYLGVPLAETNSIGMRMTLIPPGEFIMGAPDSDPDAPSHQKPQHKVRISKPFYLATYEVTLAQFTSFVDATGYETDEEKEGKRGWRDRDFEQTDRHPVVDVTWNDATAFCDWLGQKEGKDYRLPTEAAWEWACRAGTTTRWYCGDDEAELEAYAWFAKKGGTKPVGQKLPNPFGLFDMHGNVREWCSDWYSEDYYKSSPVEDPQGPSRGDTHVLRGGALSYFAIGVRSASRVALRQSTRNAFFGFRPIRTVEAALPTDGPSVAPTSPTRDPDAER